ncbi:MAG TPA: acyl-CoA thioesterase domain-containing protein [Kineosporiaceae bacterium]|nr:acyl-CoA thioesterase domain-containing protein [Kineosporiaceae bacterium]
MPPVTPGRIFRFGSDLLGSPHARLSRVSDPALYSRSARSVPAAGPNVSQSLQGWQRISYDILGLIPLREGAVSVRTLRPGRTIELVEAVLEIAGRTVVRATAWRLSRQETLGVQGGYPARLPDPDAMIAWPIDALWDAATSPH